LTADLNLNDGKEVELLQSQISDLQMQLGDFDGRNRALSEENKVLEQANAELHSKAELLDEVEENLFDKEQETTELSTALSAAKQQIIELQSESETAIASWKAKSDELEAETTKLEEMFTGQQEEAKQAISLWEERCSLLEEQLASFGDENQLEECKIQISVLKEDISAKNAILEELKADLQVERTNIDMLTKEQGEAEKVYKGHIDELEVAIQEHVTANQELQNELDRKEDALTESEDRIEVLTQEIIQNGAQSEEVVIQWQENNKELENTIAELEMTMTEQRTEATNAIEKWESRCNVLSEQLQNIVEESEIKAAEQIEELRLEFGKEEKLMQEAEKERVSLAEANLLHLKTIEDLQAKNTALEGSLSSEKEKSDSRDKTCSELQITVDNLKNELAQNREKEEELSKRYKMHEEEQTEKASSLLDEKTRLQEALHVSEGEINEFKMIVGQLEVELAEANDALQSLVTDEVTVRATEKAAAALRSQIKEMRDKQIFDHQAFSNEKDARLEAEAEVKRLKSDLALLAKVTDGLEGKEEQIQMMTSKAAAEIMHQERQEIEDIQRSLHHVVNELKTSKLKERDSEDRAAKSRMHASVCEQELISTKADIEFLRRSLSEAKQSEFEISLCWKKELRVLKMIATN